MIASSHRTNSFTKITKRTARASQTAPSEALLRRVEAIVETDLKYIDSPLFHTSAAAQECAPVEHLTDYQSTPVRATARSSATQHLGSIHLSRLCSTALLTPEEEQQLFRRMNYVKMRASKLRARISKQNPQLEQVEHIEEHLKEIRAINNRLIQSNLRLVASLVKKFVNESNAFDDLFSEGTMSLMNAVDKFDFALGYRFSTYATQAIRRHLYRAVVSRQQDRSRFVSAEPTVMEEVEDDRTSVGFDEDRWSRQLSLLDNALAQLDDRERYIVEHRFGLGADRKINTLQALAGELGICKERVRQLQQRALDKLTAMAQQTDPDQLGLSSGAA